MSDDDLLNKDPRSYFDGKENKAFTVKGEAELFGSSTFHVETKTWMGAPIR